LYSGNENTNYAHYERTSLIATLGNSTPTNQYDSYNSEGFTYKITYERPIYNKDNLRYNFGWQNISFGENVVSYDGWDGFQIREGEKANLLDVGIKYVLNKGIAKNGYFRPYITSSFGVGFFKQYTEYDAPDTFIEECDDFVTTLLHIIFDDDCDIETNYNINTVVDDRMTSTFMIVDLGASFNFNHSANYAFDFGVRYSMFSDINSNDWEDLDEITNEETFNDFIGNKLDADYKAYYLGFTWYFLNHNNINKKRNRERMI